jgi:hypothetical protein
MNKREFLKFFFLCLSISLRIFRRQIIETAQKFWKTFKDKIKNKDKEKELKDKEKE